MSTLTCCDTHQVNADSKDSAVNGVPMADLDHEDLSVSKAHLGP